MRKLGVVVLLGLVLLMASCQSNCPRKETQAYLDATEGNLQAFSDLVQRADSTARIALSPLVGEMQALRRDQQDTEVVPCVEEIQKKVLFGMQSFVDAFLDFMSDTESPTIAQKFGWGAEAFIDARQLIEDLREERGLD
jgi:hypothetical protein